MKLSLSSLPRYSFNHSSGARGMLVVAVGAVRGRWSSFEAGCLGCVALLSLLGGRGRFLGRLLSFLGSRGRLRWSSLCEVT